MILSGIILLVALGISAVVLWRRYHSRQRLLKRVAELEGLSEAGRAIVASELDILALAELIAQESAKVIDNSTFQIGLFKNEWYHILFWRINGVIQPAPQMFDLSQNSGMIGWIRQTKRPLLVKDFLKELDHLPARPRYISDTPPRSAIFIPLISGEETIGIMTAQNRVPHRFDEDDMRVLMILANQSASAFANAQLYQQERTRAAHLSLVGQIARQVNAVQDLDEIFEQVVQLTKSTFGFHPVSIFALDPDTGQAIIQASSIPEFAENSLSLETGQGLVGAAATSKQTIVVNDISGDRRYFNEFMAALVDPPGAIKAEIAIPLLVNDQVLGVLDVQSVQMGVFSTGEKMVLEALGAEVASAIHKAQQLAYQQEQAWMTVAQLQLIDNMGRSPELEDILTAVTRLTPMLIGCTFCAVLLWNDDHQLYRGGQIYGADSEDIGLFKQLQLQIGDWPTLDAVHIGQECLPTNQLPLWLRQITAGRKHPLAQVTLWPLYSLNQNVGVMVLDDLQHNVSVIGQSRLENRRLELLDNLLRLSAQALERAHLRIAQQEEAWVNTALLQVAEAVNNLIDLNEILSTIVRLVPLLVGVHSVFTLVWDVKRKVFTAGPSQGVSKMGRGLVETLDVELTELPGLAQWGDTPTTSESSHYKIQGPAWLETTMDTSQVYLFPLNARGRMVGAMLVGLQTAVSRFSTRRLNILTGIAHQAATAVVNNQLYQESAERDRLAQELKVAHNIQASLIPQGNPQIPGCDVAGYWQAARQVSGDFYDFIPLPNGNWGIVIADVADKGVPAALFMALSRTILRTVAFNRQQPDEVLVRVNEILGNDTQSDLFVTIFYAIWNPRTETLVYANAGHNPPVLIRDGQKMQLLQGQGMALGVLPEVEIERKSMRLRDGDVLLFYTDGVTEAINEDYDEFGLERLYYIANSAQKQGVQGIVEAIKEGILAHAGDTPQFDDITLVVLKRQDTVD